jgi:hypothetical protein
MVVVVVWIGATETRGDGFEFTSCCCFGIVGVGVGLEEEETVRGDGGDVEDVVGGRGEVCEGRVQDGVVDQGADKDCENRKRNVMEKYNSILFSIHGHKKAIK